MRRLAETHSHFPIRGAGVHGPAKGLILGLFLFLQQALEHDVPCNDAIGDYQSLVSIGGHSVQVDIDDSLPLLDGERFEDREWVGDFPGRQRLVAFL